MSSPTLDVPVLLLAFNRPAPTAQNLERILSACPRRLYVAVDGPRPNVPTDVPACASVRSLFASPISGVELKTDFAAQNMGLRPRVVSALDWVLSQESSVIVLEDDCHPEPSFFSFMQAMLQRYESDERVGSVCGSTAVSLSRRGPAFEYDYHFSQVGLPWGWATWRRSWRDMDLDMMSWPELRRSGRLERILGPVAGRQWTRMLDHADEYSSWWVRWLMTQWAQSRVSVVPRVSLVRNVGFDAEATHTHRDTPYARFAGMPVGALEPEYRHPDYLPIDYGLDQLTLEALLPWSPVKRGLRQLVVEGPMGLRRRLR